ncbi:MAG: flagellar export chaperone FliS [Planctomycetes bacterium]|nr:flagellar export chaperone FliS [Planctomycetota bacterium]
MSTFVQNAAGAYRRNAVLTASREKLVVLLYEGALRFMDQAAQQFGAGDPAGGQSLSRAFAIISELRTSLNHQEGSDLAAELERLYVFVQERLIEATRTRSPDCIRDARGIVLTLKEGWDGILDNAV